MSNVSEAVAKLPSEQEAIRAKCFHPTGTFVEFTKDEIEQSIPDRFEKIVRMYPGRLAVKLDDCAFTYEQLNQAANRVARAILALRGEDEEPVGLLFNKGANLVVAILGALKAGKMYVLLDSSLPNARIGFILDHSQASFLVTDNKHLSLATGLDGTGRQIINLDELDSSINYQNPGVEISAQAVAWIHYTSGSTGQPKGVIQTHQNALHMVKVHTNDYHICSDDRLTFLASRGGDIFLSLLNGSSVFPVDLKREGLAELGRLLIQEKITIYGSVTSAFRHFVASLSGAEQFPNLRLIKLIGEPLYKPDVDAFRQHFSKYCIIVNRLGGTETGTFCHYFVDHSTPICEGALPVGYAVDDTQILLLADDGKETGVDEIGEIAVRSRYLSPGYWKSPDLTTAAFFPNPEGGDGRTYFIGDLGRRLANGCLIHLGRKDFQVKIRGNRVETSEVETALLAFDNVKEAVVAARGDLSENRRLVAYLVPAAGANLTVSDIRRFLAEKLPDYMIPSVFVMMERLPVTGIGKVDRRALPDPGKSRPELGVAHVAPRDTLERQLTKVWEEVLDVVSIGVRDNFFELGGQSLSAARLCAQIEKVVGKTVLLANLYQAPTVEQMACILRQRDRAADGSCLVPIQSSGHKLPFFCVHPSGGSVHWYYDLAHHLGPDQPFYGLKAQGLDGKQPPHTRLEKMATRYVKEITNRQPRGPYFLGGLSFGGLVAFEMARQLHAGGHDVALVALFDTHGPNYSRYLMEDIPHLSWLDRLQQRVHRNLESLKTLEPSDKLVYVAERVRNICRGLEETTRKRGKTGVWKLAYKCSQALGVSLPGALTDFRALHRQLGKTYKDSMQVYRGRVALFRANEQHPVINPEPTMGWGKLVTGTLEVYDVPGNHTTLIREPHVQVLAKNLRACIEQVCSAESPTQQLRCNPYLDASDDYLRADDNGDEQTIPIPLGATQRSQGSQ